MCLRELISHSQARAKTHGRVLPADKATATENERARVERAAKKKRREELVKAIGLVLDEPLVAQMTRVQLNDQVKKHRQMDEDPRLSRKGRGKGPSSPKPRAR
jgi:hypothetical protein